MKIYQNDEGYKPEAFDQVNIKDPFARNRLGKIQYLDKKYIDNILLA